MKDILNYYYFYEKKEKKEEVATKKRKKEVWVGIHVSWTHLHFNVLTTMYAERGVRGTVVLVVL